MPLAVSFDELNQPIMGGMAPPPTPQPPIPYGLMTDAQRKAAALRERGGQTDEEYQKSITDAIAQANANHGITRPLVSPDFGLGPNIEGGLKVAYGVKKIATGKTGPERARGAHEAFGGLMEVGTQALPGAVLAAPLKTAIALGTGSITQQAGKEGLVAAGMNPDYADVVADIVSIIAGGYAASKVGGRPTSGSGRSEPPPIEPSRMADPERGAIPINAQAIQEAAAKKRTQFIDKYSPVYDMTQGKGLAPENDPYIGVRNYAGHAGKIENRLNALREILPKATFTEALLRRTPQRLTDTTDYMTLERHIELGTRPDLVGEYQIPGNRSVADVRNELAAMEARFGPQKLGEVKALAQNIRNYSNDILQEAADAGVISQAAHAAIRAGNEKYIPFDRLEYLADELDNVPRGANSFNVPAQHVVKAIKGSAREIADPITSLVRQTAKLTGLIERNKVSRQIADLAGDPNFAGVVEPVGPGGYTPRGTTKMSVLVNGAKVDYSVPKAVGESLKGMNKESADLITSWASKSAAALRAGATTLNVGFIPANAIRDFQTASIVSRVGFTPADWVRGFAEGIREGPSYERYLESGAAFSGYFGGAKKLSATARQLTQPGSFVAAKTLLPWNAIRYIGEKIELAPRIGVFERSIRAGSSDPMAAFDSRNSTVDFNKSGTVGQVLNRWIPFLNARAQGSMNMLGALKDRPANTLLKLTSVIGAPLVGTYLWNTRNHPEVWNDINQNEKDNNFLIIYGDAKNERGDYTEVVKLPKGDAKVFGNPLENFLSFLDRNNPKALGEVALQMGSDLSPIPFEREGKFSPMQVVGGIMPPAIKAAVEGVVNKNMYTEREIVPTRGQYGDMTKASPENQYFPNTPAFFKKVGDVTGISPLKWQNAVGTQLGGLGRQLSDPSTAGSQVLRRFTVARGKESETQKFNALKPLEQAAADEHLANVRNAASTFAELEALPPAKFNQRLDELSKEGKLDGVPRKALEAIVKKKISGMTGFESHLKSAPVEVRSKYVLNLLDTTPDEDLPKVVEDWKKKGIITPKVEEGMALELEKRANPVFDSKAFWGQINQTQKPPAGARP